MKDQNHRSHRSKKIVTFGEIMMRLSPPGYARFTQAHSFNLVFGGSEANVAVSLSHFGFNTAHITRFPKHDLGMAATQWLNQQGVSTTHIQYGDERMGLYFIEQGSMHRSSRVIYDRFDSAFAHIQPGTIDWDNVMKDASWLHWTGITPAISSSAAAVCLEALRAAKKNNITVSGDINYRRNLWQYGKKPQDVMPELIGLTNKIVAGISDFENCADITGETYEEAADAMMKNFPNIQRIASTIRDGSSASQNRLAAIMFDGNRILSSTTYDLNAIIDRIGAGDAFMAGLIYGWNTYTDDQQTLEFAAAACAWKHSIEGDHNIASAKEIEQLQNGENVGKLLR